MTTPTTYTLLLWGDPEVDLDLEAAYAAHGVFTERCAAQGHEILAAEELAHPRAARVLRVGQDGETVTEGPFAETTEHLGGFYLIRTADPEGLLRLAAPLVTDEASETIELRPVVAYESAADAPAARARAAG